jgi:prepilin signal peptidase PulO-like enzyme (type II secretory pathway)
MRGKCFNCKARISVVYPIAEITSGVFASGMAYKFFDNQIQLPQIVLLSVVCLALLVLSLQDIWSGEISDKIFIPTIVFILIFQFVTFANSNNLMQFLGLIITSVVVACIFGAIAFLNNSIGGGDLRVFVLLALVLGFPAILISLFLSFFFAVIGSIISSIYFKKVFFKDKFVKLVPYLLLGYIIVVLVGNSFIKFV